MNIRIGARVRFIDKDFKGLYNKVGIVSSRQENGDIVVKYPNKVWVWDSSSPTKECIHGINQIELASTYKRIT
jgi:hypothetical protein